MRWLLVALSIFNAVAVAQASADDTCLTGASTLPDQRALVSLRDATEAACPCASFNGAPGAKASNYQKCARNVLDSSIAGGTLRAACKKTATTINKGAVCG